MDFGKFKGYRPPPNSGWPKAKTAKEAWEIVDRLGQRSARPASQPPAESALMEGETAVASSPALVAASSAAAVDADGTAASPDISADDDAPVAAAAAAKTPATAVRALSTTEAAELQPGASQEAAGSAASSSTGDSFAAAVDEATEVMAELDAEIAAIKRAAGDDGFAAASIPLGSGATANGAADDSADGSSGASGGGASGGGGTPVMQAVVAECAALSALAERKQRVAAKAEQLASRSSAALETFRPAADRARSEREAVEAGLSDVDSAMHASAAAALKAKEAAELRPTAAMASALAHYESVDAPSLERERAGLAGRKRMLEELEEVPSELEAKAKAARTAADAQLAAASIAQDTHASSLPPALVQFAEHCGMMREEGERRLRRLQAQLREEEAMFAGTGCFQRQLADQREAVDEQRKLLEVVASEERVVVAELTAAVGTLPDAAALKDALRAVAKKLEEGSPAVAEAVHELAPSKKRSWFSWLGGR